MQCSPAQLGIKTFLTATIKRGASIRSYRYLGRCRQAFLHERSPELGWLAPQSLHFFFHRADRLSTLIGVKIRPSASQRERRTQLLWWWYDRLPACETSCKGRWGGIVTRTYLPSVWTKDGQAPPVVDLRQCGPFTRPWPGLAWSWAYYSTFVSILNPPAPNSASPLY